MPHSIWMAIALTTAFASVASAQDRPAAPKHTRVAVVDVQRAYDSLREKIQVEAELQAIADRVQTEDAARMRRIDELNEELNTLSPLRDPPERRRQREEERDLAVLDRQVWLQLQQAKLNRQRALRIEDIYKKLLVHIGKVAQENGYQLVLFKEQPLGFGRDITPEQVSLVIGSRKVVWAADEVDITDLVAPRLSGDFSTGR